MGRLRSLTVTANHVYDEQVAVQYWQIDLDCPVSPEILLAIRDRMVQSTVRAIYSGNPFHKGRESFPLTITRKKVM